MSTTDATRKGTPILRWTFQRNAATLTCAIDVADDQRFEVCVVPHWDVKSSVIERYDAPMTALERHAHIALKLREAGWAVTDRAAA
jgi:hypothetical protein